MIISAADGQGLAGGASVGRAPRPGAFAAGAVLAPGNLSDAQQPSAAVRPTPHGDGPAPSLNEDDLEAVFQEWVSTVISVDNAPVSSSGERVSLPSVRDNFEQYLHQAHARSEALQRAWSELTQQLPKTVGKWILWNIKLGLSNQLCALQLTPDCIHPSRSARGFRYYDNIVWNMHPH